MTHKYFSGLNYTLGNEDTSVEIALVKKFKPKNVFSVCGSGGRALPLMSESVESIALSDLSLEQLALAELRLATYKQLEHQEFLLFWGYYPFDPENSREARKAIFNRLLISETLRSFFSEIFNELHFSSVLYLGKWERTFAILAKINRTLLGSDFDRILKFDNLGEQQIYFREKFPYKRWKIVLFLLGNKALFNALLYKGDFIEKNGPDSHFEYYRHAFDRLFTRDLAQKSFFLHLCFYGRIQSLAGVPVEATLLSHQTIKQSKALISYLKEDLIKHLSSGLKTYDFLSLSDVPSYFKGDLEANYMQMIRPSLIPGAIVVIRYYLRVANCDLQKFTDISHEHTDIIESEKVQMYQIRIYRYEG